MTTKKSRNRATVERCAIRLPRLGHDVSYQWHYAINEFTNDKIGNDDWPHFMYEAKRVADEVPRMAMLFESERLGKLRKIHQQCSRSAPEPVEDNHLSCVLGNRCSECPYLVALEKAQLPPEEIDKAKAWTCATHILIELGKHTIDTSEGFIFTVDDKMYWQNVYASLAGVDG